MAIYTKLNNTTELTNPLSWSPNGTPAAGDLCRWSLNVANTVAVSANTLTVGALQLTANQTGGDVTIQQKVILTGLTVDTDGLTAGTAVNNASNRTLWFKNNVSVTTDQTWDMSGGRAYLGFPNTNTAGTLSILAGKTLTLKGANGGLGALQPNPGMQGTLRVEEGSYVFQNVANPLGTCTVLLNPNNGPRIVFTTDGAQNATAAIISNNVSIGGPVQMNYIWSGGTFVSKTTLSGPITLTVANPDILVPISEVNISGAITGSAGFTKSGAGDLQITTSSPNLNGIVTISGGNIYSGVANTAPPNTNIFPNIDQWIINGGRVIYNGALAGYSLPPILGSGGISISQASTATLASNAITFTDLTDYTGFVSLWGNQIAANFNSFVNVLKFPTSGAPYFQFVHGNGSAASGQQFIVNIPSDATVGPTPTGFTFGCYTAAATNWTTAVYANQLVGAIDFQGAVTQPTSTGAQNFVLTLGGTNQEANKISGVISNTGSLTLGITKTQGGRWILSGDNSHKGPTTLSGGELGIWHKNALFQSTLVHQTAGTTLSFDPSLTTATFGGLQGTYTATVGLAIPSNLELFVGNNGSTTAYQNALTGSGKLTKIGGGRLTLNNTIPTNNTLTGAVRIMAGGIELGAYATPSATGNHLPYVTSITIDAGAYVLGGTATAYTHPSTFTGQGCLDLAGNPGGAGVTFSPGALVGLTGTGYAGASGSQYATSGLLVAGNSPATERNNVVTVNDLPSQLTLRLFPSVAGQSCTSTVYFVANNPPPYATQIVLMANSTTALAGSSGNLYANQFSGALQITGPVIRVGVTGVPYYFNLRGTSSADNEIAGVISEVTGQLALNKVDNGRWILSNANTFTGDTRVQAGTLRLNNSLALQNSGLDWTNVDAGTLDLTSSGLTEYFVAGLKSSTDGTARTPLTIPAGVTLTVGNTLGTAYTLGTLLSGSNTSIIRKISSNNQYVRQASTAYTGTLVAEAGNLLLFDSVTSLPTATRMFANITGITASTGGAVQEYLANDTTITHPIVVNNTGYYVGVKFSQSELGGCTLQDITGTGILTVNAPSFSVAAGTWVARTRSPMLPSQLTLTCNPPAGNPRYARYIYTGPTQAYATDVLLSCQANQTMGWSIYNEGTGTLTLSNPITKGSSVVPATAAALTFGAGSDTQDIIVNGSILQGANETGALSIVKAGTRRLTLAGLGSTYTGTFTHSLGTTTLKSGTALGAQSGAGVTTFTAGTVEIDGNGTDLTFQKGSSQFLFNGAAIKNVSNNNTFVMSSGALNATTTFEVVSSSQLTLNGQMTGGNGITKTGTGTLTLLNTNNAYTGATVISQGTVEVKKIAVAGNPSSLGNPPFSAALTITMGANGDAGIRHTGTTSDSTDRSLAFVGAANTTLTLDSSGTVAGALTYTGSLSFTAGTHTLKLAGTNAATNTWSTNIPNATGGAATSLLKSGSNTWNVTVAPTLTGIVEANGGTLRFNNQTVTFGGGLVMSGGTLENGAGLLTFTNTMVWGGGNVSANVAGTSLTVTANAGRTELTPQAGNNAGLTGTATLNAGAVIKLVTETITETGDGRVLGSLNTTVKNQGVITTAAGYYQRGRHRYGGDLTFEGGSTLKIGGV